MYFVIADITNPKSSPLELQAIVPDYQIPFVPIIQEGEQPFAMLEDLYKYSWVLRPVLRYPSIDKLREGFKPADFTLPGRVAGNPPLPKGPLKDITIDSEDLKAQYYEAMGFDPQTGSIAPDTLAALGLEELFRRTP